MPSLKNHLIEDLDGLLENLNRRGLGLTKEVKTIQGQWARMGAIGAQREDHAAALLGGLLIHLYSLSSFAERCHDQIVELQKDPFQE